MEPERWRRVQEIFAATAELPPAERGAFLGDQVGDDDELRREVESLLAADAESDEFLEQPALPGRISQILADGPSDKVEGRIGPYRLLRKLGEGGMSRVYLAVRDDDFQRLVALKVIRRGLESEDLLHRFRTERQILAGLDHPNIAKLLDGGTTEDGLPYFVMEYIDGIPVDEYCDRNRLTVVQRLQLFRDVCAARAVRPPEPGRPPRHQAEQHPGDRRRHRQAARLRYRQAAQARAVSAAGGADRDVDAADDAVLRQPRAGPGPHHHHRQRRLLAGRPALQAADRPPALPDRHALRQGGGAGGGRDGARAAEHGGQPRRDRDRRRRRDDHHARRRSAGPAAPSRTSCGAA